MAPSLPDGPRGPSGRAANHGHTARSTKDRVATAVWAADDSVRDVFVNGVAVLRDCEATGATPGRGLRRG